jgi:hypothetical protein
MALRVLSRSGAKKAEITHFSAKICLSAQKRFWRGKSFLSEKVQNGRNGAQNT